MITTDAIGFVFVNGQKVCRLDRNKGVLQFANHSRLKQPGHEFVEITAQEFINFLAAPQEFMAQPRPARQVVG